MAKSFTIDYKALLKNTSISERTTLVKSPEGQRLLSALTPTELANLFPDYYKKELPDVKGFIDATSKRHGRYGKSIPEAGNVASYTGTRSQQTRDRFNVMQKYGQTSNHRSKTQAKYSLPKEKREALDALNKAGDAGISANDPRMAHLKDIPEDVLKKAGYSIDTTDSGDKVFRAPKVETKASKMSDDDIKRSMATGGEYGGGVKLVEMIAKAESGGNYNAYNRGTAGQKILGPTRKYDLQDMTVGEIMRLQSLPDGHPDRIFAAGRYQIIPSTMKEAVQALKISPDAKFDKNLQDRILRDHLLATKRQSIEAYITGKSDNRNRAQDDLSDEFASFANSRGGSRYAGTGNKISVGADKSAEALDDMRNRYLEAKKSGKSDNEAKLAAYNISPALPPNATPEQIAEARQKLDMMEKENIYNTRRSTLESELGKLQQEKEQSRISIAGVGNEKYEIPKFSREANLEEGQERLFHLRGGLQFNGNKLDPKLVNVVKAASKDLPPGWRAEMISGADARSTGTRNHPSGLAMDVVLYDDKGNAIPHDRNSAGWKHYESLYRSVHIRGKEMYPNEEFIWGGAWQSAAAGNGDPMHIQRVDRSVPGSSTSSGRYSFEHGLDKTHDFYGKGGHLSDEERQAYDQKIRERLAIERKQREQQLEAKTKTAEPIPVKGNDVPLPPLEARTLGNPFGLKKQTETTTPTAAAEKPKEEPKEESKAEVKAEATVEPPPAEKKEEADVDAHGGSHKAEKLGDVKAFPIKKSLTIGKENQALVDMTKGKMVAAINSQEGMSYDPQNKKIDVKPVSRVQPDSLKEQRLLDEARGDREKAEVRQQKAADATKQLPYTPDHSYRDATVPTDFVVNSTLGRHVKRIGFVESGHFNHGNANLRPA